MDTQLQRGSTKLFPLCPLPTTSKPLHRTMSSSPSMTAASSDLEDIINTMLVKYSSQTGNDLCNHPLTLTINECNSADSAIAVFRNQATKFGDFRNGDRKLIECLEPLVRSLYAISTSPVFHTVVSPVSPSEFLFVTTPSNAVVV